MLDLAGPGKGEGTLKLIDFGFARSNIGSIPMNENCGSLIYKAPEVSCTVEYTI